MLRQFCGQSGHIFWHEGVSLRQWVDPGAMITYSQVTDLYLPAVAAHHVGRLATLDQHIPATLIRGGESALELVSAV
jgi:hypothetical protein